LQAQGNELTRAVNALKNNANWSKNVERNIVNPNSLIHAVNKAKDGINRNLIHGNGGGDIKVDIYRAKYSMRANYEKYGRIVRDVKALINDSIRSTQDMKKVLGLRKSYKNAGTMTPSMDVNLWDKTCGTMVKTLEKQLGELNKIV
jgi:hypothetical protein